MTLMKPGEDRRMTRLMWYADVLRRARHRFVIISAGYPERLLQAAGRNRRHF